MEYRPSFSDELYSDIKPSYSDSLMHHGIKGMKWGVRRYQNEDGSLTSAGKKRYSNTNKLYKDLRKQIKRKRKEQYGRNKKMGAIGPNSEQYIKDLKTNRKQYYNSKEYKRWQHKLVDAAKRADEAFDRGDITYEQYIDQLNSAKRNSPKKNFGDPYEPYSVNGPSGRVYFSEAGKRGNKELSTAYVKDLGYSDSVANNFAKQLARNNRTIYR